MQTCWNFSWMIQRDGLLLSVGAPKHWNERLHCPHNTTTARLKNNSANRWQTTSVIFKRFRPVQRGKRCFSNSSIYPDSSGLNRWDYLCYFFSFSWTRVWNILEDESDHGKLRRGFGKVRVSWNEASAETEKAHTQGKSDFNCDFLFSLKYLLTELFNKKSNEYFNIFCARMGWIMTA